MLLRSLKSNPTYQFLLVPFIAIVLWIKSFMEPMLFPFYQGEDAMLLYQPISYLLGKSAMAGTIAALVFMILLAFLVFKINVQYSFIKVRTVLPSVLFILISSGLHELHSMHPVYPAALFLILTIDRIFNSYDKEVIHSNAFDAGILLAVGSLFYFNLVFFFPFLWIGFIILKPQVNWREYILSTLGFVFPWLAAMAYYGATGQVDEFTTIIKANLSLHGSLLKGNLAVQIYLGFLALMILLSSVSLLSQYDFKKISARKYFKAFFWVFLIACILLVANPGVSQDIIILLAIPVSYLVSNYLIYMKRPIWGEIFLYILLAGVIYLQFI